MQVFWKTGVYSEKESYLWCLNDCKLNAKAVELRFFIDSFTIIVVI